MTSSIEALWEAQLIELGLLYHVRTDRDLATARLRLEHEGLSFLTITLPAFEKDLLEAVSIGRIHSNHFAGFKRRGGLPAFLSGFLCGMFNSAGVLRDDADGRLLKAMRQILLLVSKVELPTTRKRDRDALQAYIDTDTEVGEWDDEALLEIFSDEFHHIFGRLVNAVEQRVWSRDWAPRHSSGATANRASSNARFNNSTWTDRLQNVLPWWDELLFSYGWESEDFQVLPPELEPPVRVALVPKTMKTPRIIAMEPVWTQFVQQGLLRCFTEELLSRPKLDRLMGWTDQDPNRDLAWLGSRFGNMATLDLSEASDRVSNKLVLAMFRRNPYLGQVVQACRSVSSELPDGTIVHLNKFASMGSALTFPVEAMVFHTLVSLACRLTLGARPGDNGPDGFPVVTRVFGDDLVVPTPVAHTLAQVLKAYGLKVNARKSFMTGLFRESCGADWFKGVDVSVVRMRHPLPKSEHHVGLLESALDFQHRLHDAGLSNTARLVKEHVIRVFPRVPVQPVGTLVPCLWDDNRAARVRNCPDLHTAVYRSVRFKRAKPVDHLEGYGALWKTLGQKAVEPRDLDHLERDGRSRCVGIYIGWTQPSNGL